MSKNNIVSLPTAKTEFHEEFGELAPLIREKIMDIIFEKFDKQDYRDKRITEIMDKLDPALLERDKKILAEMRDLHTEIRMVRLEKAVSYVLEHRDEIIKTVMGF